MEEQCMNINSQVTVEDSSIIMLSWSNLAFYLSFQTMNETPIKI